MLLLHTFLNLNGKIYEKSFSMEHLKKFKNKKWQNIKIKSDKNPTKNLKSHTVFSIELKSRFLIQYISNPTTFTIFLCNKILIPLTIFEFIQRSAHAKCLNAFFYFPYLQQFHFLKFLHWPLLITSYNNKLSWADFSARFFWKLSFIIFASNKGLMWCCLKDLIDCW